MQCVLNNIIQCKRYSFISRKRESEYHAVGSSLVSGLRLFSLSPVLLRAFTSEFFALTLFIIRKYLKILTIFFLEDDNNRDWNKTKI